MSHTEQEKISRECERLGWTRDGGFDFIDGYDAPGFDWRCDLSGDSGYVWSLKQMTDGDREGVATARWKDALDMDGNNVEGDTLEEFELALRFLNKPAISYGEALMGDAGVSKRCHSRFPVDWNVDHEAAAKPQQDTADEADRQYHADQEEAR